VHFLQQHSKAGVTSDEDISVDDSAEESASAREVEKNEIKPAPASGDKHLRNFMIFSDYDTYREAFALSEHRQPRQKICPITRMPAKYFDPVTRLPYANLQAFRILRETYYTQLEAKGNKDDPEVCYSSRVGNLIS
jgi:vacuolar protein sorting-associated protein 72